MPFAGAPVQATAGAASADFGAALAIVEALMLVTPRWDNQCAPVPRQSACPNLVLLLLFEMTLML